MEKMKSNLIAALGLLVLLNVFFLAAQRSSNSQNGTNPPNIKKPFQVQLDISAGPKSFTVPANQYFVVEFVSAKTADGNAGSSVQIQTMVNGNLATYDVPADAFDAGSVSLIPYARPNRTTFTRFYASGGSTVTVSGLANSVTLSGYLTKWVY